MTEGLLRTLQDVVGDSNVITNVANTPFASDWTRRWASHPKAVVRPADTAEVSAVVKACAHFGAAIVTQGGNTGLVGGAVASPGAVMLSTMRLQRLDPVNSSARQVTVGAGVTIARLQQHVRSAGLDYGVDLGSRDTATVGGTIATNAGGIRVVCHGDTRAQVLGVEAVLADSTVISHIGGLPKDSVGFDVNRLMVGSEGTLGVITAARLRLVSPLPDDRSTVLAGVDSIGSAMELLEANRRDRPLLAAEFIDNNCMELVCRVAQLPHPTSKQWPLYVLLETVDEPQLPNGVDAVVDRRLWDYRERQSEVVSTLGVVHKLDVGMPLDKLEECLTKVTDLAAPHEVFVFGHLAEGNLHIEVVGPESDDETTDVAILRLVAGLGGTISAEHGVGRAKARHLYLSRDEATLHAMRAVKDALDPRGLLNPGVVLGERSG